ncbi:MAG: acyl carrier protein [Lachnospiraceae bacterium]|nr:acyl carrier protein [Lachnospiraceae bacterium]
MKREEEFKRIVAQYCEVKPEEISGEMKFREDLGFSSLDFMSFLGELEDTFDVELEEESVLKIFTINEALDLLKGLEAA